MLVLDWNNPPSQLNLNATEVHIWMASLVQPDAVVQRLSKTLSPDETDRAGRFYFEKHRREYATARGILRNILSTYLNCEPEQLLFQYSDKGKPSLADKQNLHFNLAHSGDYAIYAFTHGREVGIDIELLRKLDDLEGLAKSNFSPTEIAVLRLIPPHLKSQAFFNCWTRKEAYVKALGDGLSYPLDQFDVTLRPGEPARLLQVIGHPEELSRWRLETLPVPQGYAAALMVEGRDAVMQMWRWDEGRVVMPSDSTIMK